jgi:hypothetical protein
MDSENEWNQKLLFQCLSTNLTQRQIETKTNEMRYFSNISFRQISLKSDLR